MKIRAMLMSCAMALFGIAGIATSVLTLNPTPAYAIEPRPLKASVTKDWASLADGVGASQTITVSGAALGDVCVPSMSVDIVSMTFTCYISAASVATVRMQNESTATVDLASGTLRVIVLRYPQF